MNFSREVEIFERDVLRLKALLVGMDVPPPRKNINYPNICWLSVNLSLKNSKKSKFNSTLALVRGLMRKKHLFLHEKSELT